MQPGAQPAVRVGDRDRDQVAQRLQAAFADGRLDDDEFDQRMRAALTARLSTDLEPLVQDLPPSIEQAGTEPTRPTAVAASSANLGKPGALAVAYKGSVRRGGRWRVPPRFRVIVYKGAGTVDLRAADLTSAVTTIDAIAYKSRIDVLVPVGIRVELRGFGASKGWSAEEELEALRPAGAPVVHVRGFGYKATIEVATKPGDPVR